MCFSAADFEKQNGDSPLAQLLPNLNLQAMAAKFTVSVVMHLILLCLFVIWHVVFVALGFASMGQDADVSQVTPPAPPATPPVSSFW